MNTNTVISLPVASDLSAYSHVLVKLTSTGLALVGPLDRSIGTMIRGNNYPANGQSAVGMAADVFLSAGNGLHYVTIGNNATITMGDELEQWSSGRVVKVGGVISGTAEADDDLITITAHGFTAGQAVIFTSLTGGTGLTAGTVYYVISTGLTANAFSVATTSGGSAVNISVDYSALSVRPVSGTNVIGVAIEGSGSNAVSGVIRAIIYGAPARTGGVEILTAAKTLTLADNGKTFFLALATGFTVTLPATVTGSGFKVTFIAKVSPTTAYIIASAGGSSGDDIVGWPINCGGADSVADGNAAGDQINFAANTALAGDQVEVIGDGSVWYAKATAKAINAITITG